MKNICSAIFIIASLGIMQGCYYDVEEELYGTNLCDSAAVTYSLSVKPILDANCNSCHSTASAQGGVILDNHASVKGVAESGKLIGAINHEASYSPMPKGGSKLSDCNISTIEK